MSNYKQEKQIQQSITDSINKILLEAVVNGFVAPSKQLAQSPFQNAFDKAQSMFGASTTTPSSNKTRDTIGNDAQGNLVVNGAVQNGNFNSPQSQINDTKNNKQFSLSPSGQKQQKNKNTLNKLLNRADADVDISNDPKLKAMFAKQKQDKETNTEDNTPAIGARTHEDLFGDSVPRISGIAEPKITPVTPSTEKKPLAQSPFQNSFDKAQSMFGASDKKAAPGISVPFKYDFSQDVPKQNLISTGAGINNGGVFGPPSSLADPEKQAGFVGPPSSLSNAKYIPTNFEKNALRGDEGQGTSKTNDPAEETYKSLLLPKKPSPVIDTVNGIMKDITTPVVAKKPSPVIDTINGIMKDITAPMGTPNTSGTAIRSPFVAKPQVNTPATNPGFMVSPQGAPASRPSQTGDFKVTPANPSTPATNPGFMVSPQGAPASNNNQTEKQRSDDLKSVSKNPNSLFSDSSLSLKDQYAANRKSNNPNVVARQKVVDTANAEAEADKQTGTNGRNIGDMRKENEQMAQARRDRGEPGLVGSPEDIAWRKAKDQKRLDDAGINKTVDQVVSEPKPMSASDIVGGAAAAGEAYRNKGMTRADFNAKRDAAEEAAYPGSTKGRPARGGGSNVGLSSDSFGTSSGSGPAKPVIGEKKWHETSEEYQARVKDAVTNFETARDANRRVNSRPVYSRDGNVTDSYTGENIGNQNTIGSNVISNNFRSRNNQGGALKENFNVTLASTRNNYYNKNINKLGSLGIPVNEGIGTDIAKGAADIAITPWGQAVPYALGAMGEIGFDQKNVNAQNAHWGNIGGAILNTLLPLGTDSKGNVTNSAKNFAIKTLADNIAVGSNFVTQLGFDPRSQGKPKIGLAKETKEQPKEEEENTQTSTPTTTTTPTATTPTTPKPPKTSTPTPGGTPTGRKPGSASTWALNRSQIHNVKPGIALT